MAALTGPPFVGPLTAAAPTSAASAGVPASALRKFRRPTSLSSGVRFMWGSSFAVRGVEWLQR
jgi:hypothetical protein